MPNNLYSYQILLASSLGFLVGTFLAAIANTIFTAQSEQVEFTFIWVKDIFLISVAMGLLGGCAALAIGAVDRGYLESIPLLTIQGLHFNL